MRRSILCAFILALAACGSSTDVKAGDPSLLFTNNLDSSWVYVTWRDGAVVEGKDSIPPHTASQCVRFSAQPDSAYWEIAAHEHGVLSTQTAPYFNPADRPAWRVIVYSNGPDAGSPIIQTTEVATPC